jgi:hypothetical protein
MKALSEMTEAVAEGFVLDAGGLICIRYAWRGWVLQGVGAAEKFPTTSADGAS